MARLEVWFLGDVNDTSVYPSLVIKPRTPTAGGFGAEFLARFFLEDSAQMQDAADLLCEVSYPAS